MDWGVAFPLYLKGIETCILNGMEVMEARFPLYLKGIETFPRARKIAKQFGFHFT